VGCEYGLMAESGRELGTSSEKVEEITLVAVDGLFAIVSNTMIDERFCEGRSFGVSHLRSTSRPLAEGKRTQRVQEDFEDRFDAQIKSG
jgi:hypothetical protein